MERGRSVGIIIAPVHAPRKGSRGRTVIELRISTRRRRILSLNSNSKPGGHTPRSAWIPFYTHKCSLCTRLLFFSLCSLDSLFRRSLAE